MDCKNCENELMLSVADLSTKLDTAKRWISILHKCLDTKEELLEAYRQENEELTNKLKLYTKED